MHIKRARTRQLFSLPFIVAHVDILSFNSCCHDRAQLARPKSASKHSQRKCVAPAAAVRGLVYLCGSAWFKQPIRLRHFEECTLATEADEMLIR